MSTAETPGAVRDTGRNKFSGVLAQDVSPNAKTRQSARRIVAAPRSGRRTFRSAAHASVIVVAIVCFPPNFVASQKSTLTDAHNKSVAEKERRRKRRQGRSTPSLPELAARRHHERQLTPNERSARSRFCDDRYTSTPAVPFVEMAVIPARSYHRRQRLYLSSSLSFGGGATGPLDCDRKPCL
jgi:hypothetical protein